MAASEPNVIALASAWVGYKGESVRVLQDEVFDAKDPIVKLYPHLFGPQEIRNVRIEQATAAPGEKRSK